MATAVLSAEPVAATINGGDTNTRRWQDIWERYNEFEEYTYYDKTLTLAQFVAEWERRLSRAVAAGCEYRDTVLALKLLARAQLADETVGEILGRLGATIDDPRRRRSGVGGGDGKAAEGGWEIFELTRTLIVNSAEQPEEKNGRYDGEGGGGGHHDDGQNHTNDHDGENGEAEEEGCDEEDYVANGHGGGDNDHSDGEEYDDDVLLAVRKNFKQELREEDDEDENDNSKGDESVRVKAETFEEEEYNKSSEAGGFHSWPSLQQPKPSPYPCDICGKAFKTKNYLKDHQVLHTNARPFKCDLCTEAFNFRSNLRHHRATAHAEEVLMAAEDGPSGERRGRKRSLQRPPLSCTSCHEEFPSRAALKRHCDKEHDGEGMATNYSSSATAAIMAEMVCCFCGASSFDSPLALQVHIQRDHAAVAAAMGWTTTVAESGGDLNGGDNKSSLGEIMALMMGGGGEAAAANGAMMGSYRKIHKETGT